MHSAQTSVMIKEQKMILNKQSSLVTNGMFYKLFDDHGKVSPNSDLLISTYVLGSRGIYLYNKLFILQVYWDIACLSDESLFQHYSPKKCPKMPTGSPFVQLSVITKMKTHSSKDKSTSYTNLVLLKRSKCGPTLTDVSYREGLTLAITNYWLHFPKSCTDLHWFPLTVYKTINHF